MFIQFDAQCQKCRKPFKAEADTGSAPPVDRGRYKCACPKCYTAVTLRGENGSPSATATGWAVPATVVTGTSATAP